MEILGKFTFRSLYITEQSDESTYLDAYNYFFDSHQKGEPLRDPSSRASLDNATLQKFVNALLTRHHERVHYWQMVGTPVGLTILRLEYNRQIQLHLAYIKIFEKLRSSGENMLRIPFTKWAKYLAQKELPPYPELKMLLQTDYGISGFQRSYLGDYRQSLEQAIDTWRNLQKIINQPSIQRMIDQRELDPICTELPLEGRAIPWQGISIDRLFECSARLQEFEYLKELRVSESFMDSWLKTMLFGPYEEPVLFIKKHIKWANVKVMLAMIDLALMTPLDPLFYPLWSGTMRWEDLHPSWRLVKITETVKNIGPQTISVLVACNYYSEFCDLICKRVGWTTPAQIIARGKDFKYNTKHQDLENLHYEGYEIKTDLSELTRALEMMKKAFTLRSKYSHVFVWIDDQSLPFTERTEIQPIFYIVGNRLYVHDGESFWSSFKSMVVYETLNEMISNDSLNFGKWAWGIIVKAFPKEYEDIFDSKVSVDCKDLQDKEPGEEIFKIMFKENFGFPLSSVSSEMGHNLS